MGKGENATNQHFILFLQCFSTLQKTNFDFWSCFFCRLPVHSNWTGMKNLMFGKQYPIKFSKNWSYSCLYFLLFSKKKREIFKGSFFRVFDPFLDKSFKCLQYKSFENTLGKGAISLFLTVFSTLSEKFTPFSSNLESSSLDFFQFGRV